MKCIFGERGLFRVACVAITMMCSSAVWSQDTYRETLLDFFEFNTDTSMVLALKPALVEVNKEIMAELDGSYDEKKSERWIGRYLGERGLGDFVDVFFASTFKKYVTEDELKELVQLYRTSEGKRYLRLGEYTTSKKYHLTVVNDVVSFMAGSPKSYKPVKGVSKEYKALFKQYCEVSDMEALFGNVVSMLSAQQKNAIDRNNLINWVEHFKKEMPTLLINEMHDKWSDEDVRHAIQIASKPASKHAQKALSESLLGLMDEKKAQAGARAWIEKYAVWLDEGELKPSPEQVFSQALQLQQQDDMAGAYKSLKASAEEGYAKAQLYMGYWYYNGIYVVKDYKKAFEWFVKAAELGDADAQCNVSQMYSFGQGVEKSPEEAFSWIQKALEQDCTDAYCVMGEYYLEGVGTPKDYKKALEYFNKAIEKQDYEGMYHIGFMYIKGEGVQKSLSKGFEWMLKAGEHEVKQAYPVLQEMYGNGYGTQKDLSKSAYWQVKYEESQK